MRATGLFISILLISCLCIPCVLADDDLVQKALNLSIVTPTPGTALLGTKDSMNEYHSSLLDSSDQLMSLFGKIMALFGISDMDFTKNMDGTLKGGLTSTQGSGKNAPETSTPVKGYGSISIRTMPGGVDVFLNGQFRGQTPDDSNKTLVITGIETGSYQVELRKSGYISDNENVPVNNGGWGYIYRELPRAL
ncbi:MAG: PEGA domain-containing protein [Methanoregula sp.]|nr:PEGA domain-containing protein [Methanoregula sp.]